MGRKSLFPDVLAGFLLGAAVGVSTLVEHHKRDHESDQNNAEDSGRYRKLFILGYKVIEFVAVHYTASLSD